MSRCILRPVWGNTEPVIQSPTPISFAAAAGEVLRRVRLGRSLSLRQVTVRSGGRFKPSSLASYERGERQISLERLFALAEVYELAPERLVAAIAHQLERAAGQEAAEPDALLVIDPLDLGASRER